MQYDGSIYKIDYFLIYSIILTLDLTKCKNKFHWTLLCATKSHTQKHAHKLKNETHLQVYESIR